MSVKGFRPAKKALKKQLGGVLFGNLIAHEMVLAVGQELQETHGWSQQQTAEFVQAVVARVRANTGKKPDAAAAPVG